MPFVILNAISAPVATLKSALTALYSHRPQPCLFQSPLLWNWDAFRMRWPINERHELTFLPVIRALGVIASLLQRVSNYHRTSNASQSASYLSSFLAKPPKRRGKKGEEARLFLEAHTINAIWWIYVHCFYSQTKDKCEQTKSIQKRNFRYFLVLTHVSDVGNVQQLI